MWNVMSTSRDPFEASWHVWLLGAVAFTAAFFLVVAGSTFLLYLISDRAPETIGSQRQRSILGLIVFCLVVAVPVSLLVVLTAKSDR